jgi:biotin transporter BioY
MLMFSAFIFLSILVGAFAHYRRNRNGFGWFALSCLFTPLFTVLLLLILPIYVPVYRPAYQHGEGSSNLTQVLILLPAVFAIVACVIAAIVAVTS